MGRKYAQNKLYIIFKDYDLTLNIFDKNMHSHIPVKCFMWNENFIQFVDCFEMITAKFGRDDLSYHAQPHSIVVKYRDK